MPSQSKSKSTAKCVGSKSSKEEFNNSEQIDKWVASKEEKIRDFQE